MHDLFTYTSCIDAVWASIDYDNFFCNSTRNCFFIGFWFFMCLSTVLYETFKNSLVSCNVLFTLRTFPVGISITWLTLPNLCLLNSKQASLCFFLYSSERFSARLRNFSLASFDSAWPLLRFPTNSFLTWLCHFTGFLIWVWFYLYVYIL